MKFDPHEFEGILDLDLCLEWVQFLERFFDIKEYCNEKIFKVAVLTIEKYASLWYENAKRQRAKDRKSRAKLGPNFKK